jgi:hypothetical protein
MKKLLVICPSRIRPDRIQNMLRSFDETKSEGTDIIIYISDCDPRLEEYKVALEGRRYEIGKRLFPSAVCNYLARKYPDYLYYADVADDHIYRTKNWDKILIDEIESHGGWGVSFGWGMIHPKEARLPQASIISGNIVRLLNYMTPPAITHAYNDNALQDLAETLGILYPRPDVVIEHQHFLNGKGTMDDNYRWVLSQETLEIGKKQYEFWRNYGMQDEIARIKRKMSVKVGTFIRCYHNTDYLKAVLTNYKWVNKIILQNCRFPSVEETTDDTKEIAESLNLKNLKIIKDNDNKLKQHELLNRDIKEFDGFDLVFFADSDELICRNDQDKMVNTMLNGSWDVGKVRIKDYAIDHTHQLPPRKDGYDNNWCLSIFKPKTTKFFDIRQYLKGTEFYFYDINMHHFGFVFPEDRLKWKVNWEAKEERVKEQIIWEAINNRQPCEPPPQEILDYMV